MNAGCILLLLGFLTPRCYCRLRTNVFQMCGMAFFKVLERKKRERERETIQCLSHKGPNRYGAILFNAGTFSWVGESMKGWCWLRAFWRHACLALAEYSPDNADTRNQAQEIHVDCRCQCCSAGIDAFRLGRFGFEFWPRYCNMNCMHVVSQLFAHNISL